MHRSTSLFCGILTLGFVACVGSTPASSDGDADDGQPDASEKAGGSSGSEPSSSSSGASSSGGTSSSSSSSSSGTASSSSSGGSTSSSSGAEPDAGDDASVAPPLDCTPANFLPGSYGNSCRAGRNSVTFAASTIPQGDYLLSGWWACNGNNHVLGSATVYPDNGTLRMRYAYERIDTNTVLEVLKGLWTLDMGAAATQLVRTEECRAGHVGDEVGGFYNYDQNSAKLVFRFPDHDEEWTRQ